MLELSDFEKGFLTAHFEAHLRFEDYRCRRDVQSAKGHAWYEHLDDEMDWVGVQVLGRMFDICIFFAEKPDPQYPQDLVAVVYECHLDAEGEYQTKVNKEWFLKEVAV